MKHTASILNTGINAIFGLAELIIGFRIILKLFGANPGAPFVRWIYETSAPLLYPFEGIFPAPTLDGGFILEFSALFALIVYSLIAYLLTDVVRRFNR